MIVYVSPLLLSIVIQPSNRLCSVPIVAQMQICGGNVYSGEGGKYLSDLAELQISFESVVKATSWNKHLALNMKDSQIALNDLNAMVCLL